MKHKFFIMLVFFVSSISAQTVVTTTPKYPTENDSIIIYFDVTNATHANKIAGYTGTVYAHTGVTLQTGSGTPGRWQKVIGTGWPPPTGANGEPVMTRTGTNTYTITIGNPRKFYSVTNSSQKITELCFVLRNADGTKQTEDIFIPLYSGGISVVLNSPKVNTNFGDPMRSPVFIQPGESKTISVSTSEIGTKTKSIGIFINGVSKSQSLSNSLNYNFIADENPTWKNEIKIIAVDTANVQDSVKFVIVRNPVVKDLPLPEGNQIGINIKNGYVLLALYAPYKKNVYVLCNYNDWKIDTAYFMNRYQVTADSVLWWIQMPASLANPPGEVAYQFLIDGSLRVQDPYAEKILDPWNDTDAELQKVYPNLMAYPNGKTEGIVSVYSEAKEEYNWHVPNFTRPSKDKLVIYELLIRDFISTHSYKTLIDTLNYFRKLGVNAIELMPVNEFEGNSSWGYNPMMYFAPDKYYGTQTQLKQFIDACHESGIAVIMDIVLNHSYGLSPMVRMYWDSTNSRPAANSPWFNQTSPNPVFSWGYDFNHQKAATKYFVDRVTSFWLTEYKMDGFRFDFTKGFTNSSGDGSAYDASRIVILKRIADKIWQVVPDAYVILEHFAANNEEIELSNYGMMLWGNMNYAYNQATMGFSDSWNFGDVSYKNRGWTKPNLVGYMESHDEERLMFKNITYGNSSGSYNVKNLTTALDRMKLAATFFITVPGPKMIWQFGELGYDKSINYPSGTSSDRLTPKPILWNYFSDADRKDLFNVFAGLIRLKENYPVFSTSDYTISTSGATKSIHLNDNSLNVAILGNFDVTAKNIDPVFQSTGKWYEFFTHDSIDVSKVNAQISLEPGEYRLYTSVRLPSLDYLVDVKKQEELPKQFRLEQNYPNPFNPSTIISYQLPSDSRVTLKVYDVLGREVATLVNEFRRTGSYKSQFSIRNSQLSSGIYFYQLTAGDFIQTKKMILVK